MEIAVYRGSIVNIVVNAQDNSQLSQKLNGEDVCKLSFREPNILDIQIGDYITVFGKRYNLNLLPNIVKKSNREYQYDCTFESYMYDLRKVQFMNGLDEGEFFLTGDLDFFVNNIISNMQRVDTGWAKLTVQASTVTKNLQFSNENCLAVLQRLCTEYSVSFFISNDKELSVYNPAQNAIHSFAYGQGQGLYSLTRQVVDSKDVITRLYPQGSTNNIPANYRNYSTRLKISAGHIDQNIDKYGIIEASYNFEDIYPRFNGAITSAIDEYTFRCSTIDFDLNAQMISGTSPKVHFNAGQLAGYEFEIVSYNNTIKEIVLKPLSQEKTINNAGTLENYSLPNATIPPAIGDKFVFIDIIMPDSYITAAEAELLAAATDYLSQNSEPRVQYMLEVDPIFMNQTGIVLTVGDYINVKDIALGIDKNTQVTSLTRSLYNEDKWTLDLSDQLAPQIISRALSDIEDIKRIVVINRLNDISRALRGWRNIEELKNMIFDQDNYFDTGKIKPESIETLMLSVGSKAGNFTLSCFIEPNYMGDKTKCNLGAGTLVHLSIAETPRVWTISANNYTALSDGTAYYIYARCTRSTANSGQLVLDTTQRKVDSDPTNYYFLVGVLNSVVNGYRNVCITYGNSSLYGRNLRAGAIVNYSGDTVMDIDTREFYGKFTFRDGQTDEDYADNIQSAADEASSAAGQAGTAINTANSAANTANSAANTANSAQSLAASKRRNFTVTPTTPYDVGDNYVNGTEMYTCVTARSSGNYNANDWAKRVNYDSTQSTIDGGIITAGSIRVKDSDHNEWGGLCGGGNGTGVGIWLGASYTNRNSAPLRFYHDGKGFMAGWTVAYDSDNGRYYFAKDTGTDSTSAGMAPEDFPFYAGATYADRASAKAWIKPTGESFFSKCTVKSNSVGKRIEIDAANNNITIYQDSGAGKTGYARLDDNVDDHDACGFMASRDAFSSSLSYCKLTVKNMDEGNQFIVDTIASNGYIKIYAKGLPQGFQAGETNPSWHQMYYDINSGRIAWG